MSDAAWSAPFERLDARTHRYRVLRDGQPLSYSDAIAAWTSDAEFRRWYAELLAGSELPAYRWETPPVTSASADAQPLEFVLLRSDALQRRVDRQAFASHFRKGEPVVAFSNLSGDAELVVPAPTECDDAYSHLAGFLRAAPPEQVDALWQATGRAMSRRLAAAERPVWLSTAGMGVAWLHIRLDRRPKYYGHAPYTKMRV